MDGTKTATGVSDGSWIDWFKPGSAYDVLVYTVVDRRRRARYHKPINRPTRSCVKHLIVECTHCGEPFKYWEISVGGWPTGEGEDIDCPNCFKTHARQETTGYFGSAKLTDEEKAAYLAEKAERRW